MTACMSSSCNDRAIKSIIRTYVENIVIPETLALFSTVVESATKAKQEGNPIPNEIPESTLRIRKNGNSWKNVNAIVVTTPDKIHAPKNFFWFNF